MKPERIIAGTIMSSSDGKGAGLSNQFQSLDLLKDEKWFERR
jgi:hypothetical protein